MPNLFHNNGHANFCLVPVNIVNNLNRFHFREAFVKSRFLSNDDLQKQAFSKDAYHEQDTNLDHSDIVLAFRQALSVLFTTLPKMG